MITMSTILSNDTWSKIKPLGMSCTLLGRTTLAGELTELIYLKFSHRDTGKKFEAELAFPIFNDNIIHWRNSKKALMYISEVQADSDFQIALGERPEDERMTLHIFTPEDILVRRISSCIGHAIRNWFYNQEKEPDIQAIQISIDRWFANGKEWRVLKYSNIAQQDQKNGIIVDSHQSFRTHDERLISKIFNPKLWNTIDINSTSFSDKVNNSFRLVSGTTIDKNKLVVAPEKSAPFCDVLLRHGIGLNMNAKRIYLLRNIFEASIDITEPTEPIVSPYKKGDTMLSGTDLITAIMHLKHYTHEDGIAISESAAKKLHGSKIITQLVESDLPIVPVIKKGDSVNPSSVIALDGDKQVLASKLYVDSIVEDVSISKGKRFGIETNRVWLKYRSFYPLATGDKVSNRHGGKGVVTIVSDDDMPWCPNTGEFVEVCIAPESIVNRKSMSVFWEMLLTRKAWSENHNSWDKIPSIHVKSFDIETGDWPKGPIYDTKGLADVYGHKFQLVLNNEPLQELTYVSKLFWLRLDKIAQEIISVVKSHRTKNNLGAFIDSAKVSGQRCNAAKLLALAARGMDPLIADIIDNNMSGKAFFNSLIGAIHNQRYIKSNDINQGIHQK